MDICYIYDGSFEGLLTAIYNAYYSKDKPIEILEESEFQPSLITQSVNIHTDAEKANKVLNAIKNKISENVLDSIYYVFLSNHMGKGTLIYNYIKLGFNYGAKVDLHTYNDTIIKIHKTIKKVTGETHLMLGFVRFQLVGSNIYYSTIEPDHNILALIAPHFEKRLSDQNWIIHDIKREIAAIYNLKEWVIVHFEKSKISNINPTNCEDFYNSLWKDYFSSTTIMNRLNPKLQKMHVPRRYWKHMNEFK